LLEHGCNKADMLLVRRKADLAIEFELPEAVRLSAIEVWNYNDPWGTTNGIRRADVKISPDGSSWETAIAGAEFAEAEGSPDYDQPTVLKLNGLVARKVRFDNLVSIGGGDLIGLSEAVFHEATGDRPSPLTPLDDSIGVDVRKVFLEWSAVADASAYSVYVGTNAGDLKRVATTGTTRFELPELWPDTTYYWRADAVPARGKIVQGRTARFKTTGLIAHWRFDEASGPCAHDDSGNGHVGRVIGPVTWAPGKGILGGAIELNGRRGHVESEISPVLNPRTNMSVSLWVKIRTFGNPDQAIMNASDGSWSIERHGEQDTVRFVLGFAGRGTRGTQQVSVVSTRSLCDGQWHHIVATYDGQLAVLYVDGVREAEMPANENLCREAGTRIFIGSTPSRSASVCFDGWIDDVRLYGFALGRDEVAALFEAARK
ncbi:MAG: LamG domain-containing protein, partial [Verrucomicrobiae bacterium]|nr:LamG domain-containing protein [Verrucomicrobiae bacterium]